MRCRRKSRAVLVILAVLAVVLVVAGGRVFWFVSRGAVEPERKRPDTLLMEYIQYIIDGNYEAMYGMLDGQGHLNTSLEDLVDRNEKIYEGIEASNIRIEIIEVEQREDGTEAVNYQITMDTMAGEVSFLNQVDFHEEETVPVTDGMENGKESKKRGKKVDTEYKMSWSDWVIFPQLTRTDKVRVHTDKALRGRMLDRDGNFLAGEGIVSLVGLVLGKMNRDEQSEHGYLEEDIRHFSVLLGVSEESIIKKLSAGWVKDDFLAPPKTLKKVNELDLKSESSDEGDPQNRAMQDELLTISGIMIMDTTVRGYPLEKKAAHLVGYIQNVTAEDLEKHQGKGYLMDNVIGRNGMEGLYETELKGQNGIRITIVTADGTEKLVLASTVRNDGQDIRLTIDNQLQSLIYDTLKDRRSCTAAMNPLTGKVLALMNTPNYDNNDFILGLSKEKWASLSEDERNPMLNRFRQRFAPGSPFKSITGAIGLVPDTPSLSESFGETVVPMSWQKDASWGRYEVTALHSYSPVNPENAYIYSGNTYFARAILEIGVNDLMAGLDRLGFNQDIPFEITLAKDQYSSTDNIETEIQLVDSGYGQGEALINPAHLVPLYTMSPNHGTVLKPSLLYKKDPFPEPWTQQACPPEATEIVEQDLIWTVSSEHEAGHKAMRSDIMLAGKTGIAEIKAPKDDTSGTELGQFAVHTADSSIRTLIIMVSMVEDVKNEGGSGLVVERAERVLDSYLR